MYLHNKYTRWYYNIITRAQQRQDVFDTYTEKHHIIPRSLGGANDKSNLVRLTAKEHFICHLLLPKMTTDKARRSMAFAAWQMTNIDNRERYSPTSRIYDLLKQQLSQTYKGVPKTYKNWLGKTHTKETRELQSKVKQGKNNPMYGRKQTDKTRAMISSAQIRIPKPVFVCPYCNKSIGGKSNYLRWHGNNCPINKV